MAGIGLRALAQKQNKLILEKQLGGFGYPITIIDPSGKSENITGYSNDIAQVIDPDTGQVVSGRSASVSISNESLTDVGYTSLPVSVSNSSRKPWVIIFDDIGGSSHKFKISQSNPDRAIGCISCLLELYK